LKSSRRFSAIAVLTLAIGAAGVVGAGAAAAHVTVSAPGVTVGATDAVIIFHVPDESASASTVGLTIQLPTDTPIAGVLVAPLPGWTAKITHKSLSNPIKTDDGDIIEVVSEIDWTADAGAGIKPGYFGQFTIIGGKLPDDATSLTFKAVQTYSDKSVDSWIEEAAAGSTVEPEHPAPTLELAAATGADRTASASPTSSSALTVSAATSAESTGSSSGETTVGVVLGIVGIVLGAAALAIVMLRRRPSSGD
jgi:periplasmic copper chaperone A